MGAAILVSSLLNKLASLIPQASSSTSAEQELHELGRIMKRIHDVLDDAEEMDITDRHTEQLRLRELKEVAYDAEDAMDEYEYELLRANVEARRRLGQQATRRNKHADVDEVFHWKNFDHPKVSISYQLAHKIKEIRERFQEITYEWGRINLRAKDGKRRRIKTWKPVETTSYFDSTNTFGREDEKRKIIEWLLQEDEQCNVSVLPIVGMGGIGKTTVAQMVYNDPIVRQKFRLRGWVCVSEDFNIVSLTRKIILSFSLMELDYSTSPNELHKILKDSMKGEDIFLVLDDVWNRKSELWDSLKAILVGLGGSKIIVTTRNDSVAKIMQTMSPIYLSHLSFHNCWLLFSNIVFERRDLDHSMNHELIDIGKKIVKKCAGLPLAVKVLAGVLRYEDDEEAWIDALESELWEELDDERSHILPALRLSYDRMPMELRPCFMYLSLFPKDSTLHRSEIIKQWMSQGFLHRNEENVEEEDVGDAYYNELLERSIIQCYSIKSKEVFIMHDLIHDLAQLVARDDYLLITSDKLHSTPKTIRHVSIYLNENDAKVENLKSLFEFQLQKERLRTLIIHSAKGFSITDLLPNLICIRTLILTERYLEVPDSICNLKHVRYLDPYVHKFAPESIYNLFHLQTFHPRGSLGEQSFVGIGDLIYLRHLYIDSDLRLPREVGGLTNLQTLRYFTVGADGWQCKVRDLKHLDNLREDLSIKGLGTVKWLDVTPPEALLKTKPGIKELYLFWGETDKQNVFDDHDNKLAEQVLECLQPHPNLTILFIQGYQGAKFPMWLGSASFSKLGHIDLSGGNCISLPTLGQLPCLKELIVMQMKRVKSVGRELLSCDPLNPVSVTAAAAKEGVNSSSCYFPSLEELTFREMEEWVEWNGVEVSDFPCLRLLCIDNCPKLKRLPSLASLTELSIYFHGWSSELVSDCCRLPMLRTLKIIYHTGDSLSFPDYQVLRALEELDISMSFSLNSVTGLGNLSSLRHLAIEGCPWLRMPPGERLPPGLKDVQVIGCPEVEEWYHNQVLGCSGDRHHHQPQMGE